MFASLLTSGSARPAAVQVVVRQTVRGRVIQIKGEARDECVGALLDGLVAPRRRPTVVILDLSELRSVSPMAVGVLTAYCRNVIRTGGRVRLTGALQPTVKEWLVRFELLDLIDAGPDSGPADSLTPEQDRRLAELMARWWRARDSGNTLPQVEQDELEALASVELHSSAADETVW
jgi:anti-anti-sigma regulatory factor